MNGELERVLRSPAWRVLRQALHGDFRSAWERELIRSHLDRRRARGAGASRFWAGLTRDALVTGVADRFERREWGGRGMGLGVDELDWHLRAALRNVGRHPRFSLAVVAILTIGIGANLTVFTVLDRLILSGPPHVESPETLRRVQVFGISPFGGPEPRFGTALSYPDYRTLQGVEALSGVAGVGRRSLTLEVGGRAESIRVEVATGTYFDLLGVRPYRGRFFGPDDDVLGAAEPVAVLSHAFWIRRFSGEASALGGSVDLGKGTYRIVGVAPPEFTGVDLAPVDVWVPFAPAMEAESGDGWVDAHRWLMMEAVARVEGERTVAEEAATAAYRASREGVSGSDPEARVHLSDLREGRGPEPPPEVRVAQFLGILTLLVLLVSAANVGNLALARGIVRDRETAIRAALGADRRRLVLQSVLEMTVLCGTAVLFSLWIAVAASGTLFRVLLPEASGSVRPTGSLLIAGLVLGLLGVVVAGFVPALQGTRRDVMSRLRSSESTKRERRSRATLVFLQSAFSVVILIAAGLFIRSARAAAAVDLGFDLDVVAVDVETVEGVTFGESVTTAIDEALERIRALPGVEAASAVTLPPLSGMWGVSVAVQGGETIPSSIAGPAVYGVEEGFFEILGLPVVRGRPIRDADTDPGAAPVAVVGQALAARLWPGESGVGKCLLIRPDAGDPPCTTVVGIASDFRNSVVDSSDRLLLFLPPTHAGIAGSGGAGDLVVRLAPGATPVGLAREIAAASPSIRLARARTLRDLAEPQLRSWRLGATLLAAFGVLALLVTAAGLHSTLAFEVARRKREIGIRIALGARRSRLLRVTLLDQLRVVVLGALAGVGIGLTFGSRFEGLLFETAPGDPLVLVGVVGLLSAVAVLAVLVPARRATRVDPMVVLTAD